MKRALCRHGRRHRRLSQRGRTARLPAYRSRWAFPRREQSRLLPVTPPRFARGAFHSDEPSERRLHDKRRDARGTRNRRRAHVGGQKRRDAPLPAHGLGGLHRGNRRRLARADAEQRPYIVRRRLVAGFARHAHGCAPHRYLRPLHRRRPGSIS